MPRPEDDELDERPRNRRRDEDEADDDRPRRRRRPRDDDDDDRDRDSTGGLIPYKNPKALAAYYCGVFGLISCFLGLGIFGIVPIVLGFMGLSYAKKHPKASGKAHAITGIILGLVELLTFLGMIVFIIITIMSKN